MIAEWVAPSMEQKIFILISSTLAIILILISKNEDNTEAEENKNQSCRTLPRPYKSATLANQFFPLILLFLFAILSLKARRNLPFFYTIFFYVTLPALKAKIDYLKFVHDRDKNLKNDFILSTLLSIFIISFTLPGIAEIISFNTSWSNYCQNSLLPLPCRALEKTNLKKLSGHLFTAYEWGGFLIWQAPKLKVFVDGRMSAWQSEKEPYPGSGKYPYQVYLYVIQARPGWNEILKKYKTDYLLIGNGTFLDLELQKNAKIHGWQESYRDQAAVFYKKV